MKVVELHILKRTAATFGAALFWTLAIVWTTQVLARIDLVTDKTIRGRYRRQAHTQNLVKLSALMANVPATGMVCDSLIARVRENAAGLPTAPETLMVSWGPRGRDNGRGR